MCYQLPGMSLLHSLRAACPLHPGRISVSFLPGALRNVSQYWFLFRIGTPSTHSVLYILVQRDSITWEQGLWIYINHLQRKKRKLGESGTTVFIRSLLHLVRAYFVIGNKWPYYKSWFLPKVVPCPWINCSIDIAIIFGIARHFSSCTNIGSVL